LIYTRQESEVRKIEDLVGQSIAFEHPYSFSSYYLPKHVLERSGLTLVPLEGSSSMPSRHQVGYVFSRNEKNNALWVDKGIVTAGALNDGDWNNPERVPPNLRKRLKIIYRSEFYPRAFEVATNALSPEAATALQSLLLSLHRPEHEALLDRYEKTEAFAAVQPEDLALLTEMVINAGNEAP
ncbi:MAG: phosphate/phosphite/phosphonate ABC transporter substrate-binding protein, partial [Oceanospirillales bacterium]|nr:phosphate/phosphite/phosphonate ABC transporter substrate-binding protein [Oceanospirillales bacterium]